MEKINTKEPKIKLEIKPNIPTLNSYVALSGICSRRKAAELIKQGFIRVNNIIVKNSAYRVKNSDEVYYDGKIIKPQKKLCIVLNKPKGYITTVSDEKGRKTVLDLINIKDSIRLYPIGRLDRATSGILLLTNDGDLALKLAHPRYNVRKAYNVILDKKIPFSDIDKIKKGLKLQDGYIKVDFIDYNDETSRSINIILHSGKNRIIRRIFEKLEYKVKKLDRVQYANITKKALPQGHWRFLTSQEINSLISYNR
jgi:23S rRNA pseudouridine2605 synthase